MVEVKNLTKKYGTNLALNDVSFTLEEGRIYGLLGRNGAGKSTTMNIMTGYLGATSGDVLINGISITEKPEEAKKLIGYLPEIPPLYIDMTVKEYLFFAARLKKIPAADIKTEVEKVVEFTGLQGVYKRLIRNLSKGYRQRTGLAYALLGFPEIIILDEPTVGIDPGQIAETRELIRRIGGKHIIVFSSHVLSEVQSLCDHIIIISKGHVAAQGTIEELESMCAEGAVTTLRLKADRERAEMVLSRFSADGIKFIKQADGVAEFEVSGTSSREKKEELFNLCCNEKMPIIELHSDMMGLEDLFLRLTGEEESI